jgi:hypothetical protein
MKVNFTVEIHNKIRLLLDLAIFTGREIQMNWSFSFHAAVAGLTTGSAIFFAVSGNGFAAASFGGMAAINSLAAIRSTMLEMTGKKTPQKPSSPADRSKKASNHTFER